MLIPKESLENSCKLILGKKNIDFDGDANSCEYACKLVVSRTLLNVPPIYELYGIYHYIIP